MEDSEIIELYWNRSEGAISRTEEKYGAYCRTISVNILGSREDAAECVNDTWLRVWNAIPPERPSVLRTWLGRITRNLSIDRWQKRRAQKRGGGETERLLSELADCVPAAGGLEEGLEEAELARRVGAFLRELPQESRVIFLRRYYYGDSVRQAAHRLGVSESKVKSSLFRTRNVLRASLEKEGMLE